MSKYSWDDRIVSSVCIIALLAMLVMVATSIFIYYTSELRLMVETLNLLGVFVCIAGVMIINEGGETKATSRLWEEVLWVVCAGVGFSLLINLILTLHVLMYLVPLGAAAMYRRMCYMEKP